LRNDGEPDSLEEYQKLVLVELGAVKSCGFGNVSETRSAVEPQTSKAPFDLING
jgi:hypothetical protein